MIVFRLKVAKHAMVSDIVKYELEDVLHSIETTFVEC